jgi:hypothetical protein
MRLQASVPVYVIFMYTACSLNSFEGLSDVNIFVGAVCCPTQVEKKHKL